jgi:cytoskeletal protein RodZ
VSVAELPLRNRRLRAQVTLESISESTRIATRFLNAIENGDYATLPGGVYNTSYIRQYARAIGYDADEILTHYREATAPVEPARALPEARPLGIGKRFWVLLFD